MVRGTSDESRGKRDLSSWNIRTPANEVVKKCASKPGHFTFNDVVRFEQGVPRKYQGLPVQSLDGGITHSGQCQAKNRLPASIQRLPDREFAGNTKGMGIE